MHCLNCGDEYDMIERDCEPFCSYDCQEQWYMRERDYPEDEPEWDKGTYHDLFG